MESATMAPDGAVTDPGEGEDDDHRSIAEEAFEADQDRAAVASGDIGLEGSQLKLSFSVGGKEPTGSTIRLAGGKREVEGQFKKGETVRFVVEAKVTQVAFQDEVDAETKQAVGCARRHVAHITSISLVKDGEG